MSITDNVSIRQARLYDIPVIARIEYESSPTPWSAESLTHDVKDNDKAYMAVIEIMPEGSPSELPDVIGYADMWVIAGEAQLNNIAIDEAYRGRHNGEQLLSHMLEKSAELGCEVMTLEVRAGNRTAIALYTKMGFRQVAVRKAYYRDNREDAILMDKNITAVEADYSIDIEFEVEVETSDSEQND